MSGAAPSRDRVRIAGVGAVTPIGASASAFTAALRAGRSGVALIDPADPRFARATMKSTVAATCDAFDAASVLEKADTKRLPRLVPLAIAAAREALAHAFGDADPLADVEASRRIGLVLGTGGGGIDFTLDQARSVYTGGNASLWTITNATHGNLAGELSIRLGLRGPSQCVSTGCASSSDACGLAMDLLRSARPGAPDAMVVVGADAHARWETLEGMEFLRVISTRDWSTEPDLAPTACRPFDATRDGFVLGEGAWAVVLVRTPSDIARSSADLGELAGYGATCDAYHRVRPDPDVHEAARAIRDALADAGAEPSDVHLLHYHGTGTRLNDAQESRTIRLALGDANAESTRGSAIKSAIGHPQGASGLASLVAAVGATRGLDGGPPFVPPTLHLNEPDPECDLDYTPNRAAGLDASDGASDGTSDGTHTILVNCLAFGAKNSALVARVPTR